MEEIVRRILRAVSREKDKALFRYTKRFDRFAATRRTVEVSPAERRKAWRQVDRQTVACLKKTSDRIRRFHEKERLPSWLRSERGLTLGLRWTPLERVGIYVPGGRAVYPSTVLMNAIPAVVAGVREIVMTTPAPGGKINPALLVAADLAGISRIFKVGGAQAIAALAFGTPSIPKVDKIVGPGNRFVTEAKRQVFGRVGIDTLAGPSELVVVADRSADPAWVAADLVAQAEHDPEARPIVISTSTGVLQNVGREVKRQVRQIPRQKIAVAAFRSCGRKIRAKSLDDACRIANAIAPEHLSLQVKNPRRLLEKIRHAGAVFLGPFSAVALGDYGAGPNHVLPTGGAARFSSPLGVWDFRKATSILEAKKSGFKKLAPVIKELARVEGLMAHARSVEIRLR